MKKSLFLAVFLSLFLFAGDAKAQEATTTESVAPVVSIGIGNGNTPENTGPVHMGVFHGVVPVFATVSDDDLLGYHFRIIRDGGFDGHTCTEELALYAEENQGYASTTLSKESCGFNFNQSVFQAESLINQIIATINTVDLGAFGGDGDYWFILGANDLELNRTHSDYTQDPRVKVTVDNTPPTTFGEVEFSSINGPFDIKTTATDLNGVATTTLLFSNYDGLTCGAFSPIVSLAGSMQNTSTSTYSWLPVESGMYCVGAFSSDVPGNVETEKTLASGVNFEKPVVVTPPPSPTPPPAPVTSSGGGGGGNGPIVNSYGVQNVSSASFSTGPTSDTSFSQIALGPSTDNGEFQPNRPQETFSQGGTDNVGTALSASGLNTGDVVPETTSFNPDEESDELVATSGTSTNDQLAAVVSSGFNLNWLWLLLALVIALGYYFYSKKA